MWRSILLLLLLPTGEALAFKTAPPRRHTVPSANREFLLDVDPGPNRLTVLGGIRRDEPQWSFHHRVWLQKRFLSNDGKVVAIVAWEFVQADSIANGVCIEFWSEAGKIKEYGFAEVCPNPRHNWFGEPGPGEWSTRIWLSEAESNGDTLRIRTTDEFEYVFAMDDGSIVATKRIGFPWWSYWAVLAFAIVGTGVIVMISRRLRRRSKSSETIQAGN